ncbi:gamma-butyrobetaine dioxygenase [Eudromia elegans]
MQAAEAADGGRELRVRWADGSESRFPCVWLRDNCRCPSCFLPSAQARSLPLEQLDVEVVAHRVALEPGNKLAITWPDGHASEYEAAWLRARCFSEGARAHMQRELILPGRKCVGPGDQLLPEGCGSCCSLQELHPSIPNGFPQPLHTAALVLGTAGPWSSPVPRLLPRRAGLRRARVASAERHPWGAELELPQLPFPEVLHDAGCAYAWLRALRRTGVVLLRGAPTRPGALRALGHRLGFLRLTFYGPTWLVQDKADANNVAYTRGPLALHTDYPALQHPPGVQLLHCIEQAAAGGESELVDGLRAARLLRKRRPDAFRLLVATAVDYSDVGADYCDFAVHCKQCIIDVDACGEPVRINYNNATRASVLDMAPEDVRPFYAALRAFDELLRRPEHVVTLRLEPGDVLTFDNWRVLHGRRGYEGTRCLEGAYADWDVVLSRLQLLRDELHGSPAPPAQQHPL